MPVSDHIINSIHPSWREIVLKSFDALDREYLRYLLTSDDFFPDRDNFLNAFKTLSLEDTRYILFGQDPYPRYESAIGYAFIDGRVKDIFANTGLSKEINRATSLRNFIKMLLLNENSSLRSDLSQEAISKIDKKSLCKDMDCLRKNFEKNGILLLNMALIFSSKKDSSYHIKKWKKFFECFLSEISDKKIELILFGKIAQKVESFKSSNSFKRWIFPHPYNLSFIEDREVQEFFKPLNLLKV